MIALYYVEHLAGFLGKNSFIDEFNLLTKRGMIGLFDHFELVEVVRYADGSKQPTNVLTIAVAIENGTSAETQRLNADRIRLSKLKGCNFGVFRSVPSIDAFRSALSNWVQNGVWQPSSMPISVGTLTPVPKQFVPPNSATEIPLNAALKNNFFAGSYVLELFDVQKTMHSGFEKSPSALQELSESVSELIPLQLASLSDRLGNIVIQFPIDAIRVNFQANREHYQVEVAWHPLIAPRDLIATAQTEYDKSIISFAQATVQSGTVGLGNDPGHGGLNGFIWDTQNEILLAATGEASSIKTIFSNMVLGQPEPRTIPRKIGASEAKQRIKLSSPPMLSVIGDNPDASITKSISKRAYDRERSKLAELRQFDQYASEPASGSFERERALNDVRKLIASHGAFGVWLWDPFLSPQDLLDTLFHNPTSGAPMRALTSLKVYTESNGSPPQPLKSLGSNKKLKVLERNSNRTARQQEVSTKSDLLKSYRSMLSNLPGNFRGLGIEFRSAHGQLGWQFHDRFLIFPKSEHDRAKAWSLGTSVNSLGKSHHILQQADNAQLIADAFQLLWDAVDHSNNLIWKCP